MYVESQSHVRLVCTIDTRSMKERLVEFITKKKLIESGQRVLLAVSGGMDSRLMCELFYQAEIEFVIAHCNFGLRKEDSQKDEEFCRQLAQLYKVPFYSCSFKTEAYARTHKLSIQMAARELRYEWLEEMRKSGGCDLIATAHHGDDLLETVLLNLTRGTGIAGLHGILPKAGRIIRPLLFLEKKEIETYIKKNKLQYREDNSNASVKYTRNKIRHQVIPVLKELNPSLVKSWYENAEFIQAAERMYGKEIERWKKKMIVRKKNEWYMNTNLLREETDAVILLSEMIREFGFGKQEADVILTGKLQSGKQFVSGTHLLQYDRGKVIVSLANASKTVEEIPVYAHSKKIKIGDSVLRFETQKGKNTSYWVEESKKAGTNSAFLDFSKLKFPLTLRNWKSGDYFFPLGMKGKKKLSDFFADKKIPLIEKKRILLLTSGKDIVWVSGMRMDNRYRVAPKTKSVLKVSIGKI